MNFSHPFLLFFCALMEGVQRCEVQRGTSCGVNHQIKLFLFLQNEYEITLTRLGITFKYSNGFRDLRLQ